MVHLHAKEQDKSQGALWEQNYMAEQVFAFFHCLHVGCAE